MENLHEKIAQLCIEHFNKLPKTGKPTQNEWTILSCIIKEDTVQKSFEVVSLGTGTKCIGKSKLSNTGDILNDSHAEVVCRRAFLRYIYEQINLISDSDIFIINHATAKCALKNSIAFHFFTSHVPCGDAAIFEKPEQDSDDEMGDILTTSNKRPSKTDINPKTKQLKVDTYRTGAKCLPEESKQDLKLPGLKYHSLGAVRTKPGRGDPTLSVSCSDKLTRWHHVGLQGALLSLLLEEPIYLKSFTVAGQTPYSEPALRRAFYDRIPSVDLSVPYRQQKVIIGQAISSFEFHKAKTKQPCPSSIIWAKIKARPLEIAVEGKKQGVTKKKQSTRAGRLQICKIELYRSFIDTAKHLQLPLFQECDLSKVSYATAKAQAKTYQKMWQTLKDHLHVWTVKSADLLQFVAD